MAKNELENKDKIEDFNWENIFEDFSSDELLWKDIEEIKKEETKDFYYYLSFISGILKVFNFILFVTLLIFISYNYIQKKEELKSYDILSPVCNLILWDSYVDSGECYWLFAKIEEELVNVNEIEKKQFTKVINIISDVYTIDNFMNSESMIFLINKSENKFDPINILSEFDKLKNEFEPLDKSKIECWRIAINNQNEFDIKCTIYSSDWDNDIKDFDSIWSKLMGWTSISIASSFIEFIEKNSNTFEILEKQKNFSSNKVSWKWIYTKSTEVNLKLKYNSINNLSL